MMKNKKRFTLSVIFLFGMMITTYGQKVYRDGNGKFFFEAEGMPAESYTRTAKPTNLPNITTKENNHTIAYKFEIADKDLGDGSGKEMYSWNDAITLCQSKGNGWRLPTFRELNLIDIFHKKLEALSGFTPFKKELQYWGATEPSVGQPLYIIFSSRKPEVGWALNSNEYYVRCIRDIVTP